MNFCLLVGVWTLTRKLPGAADDLELAGFRQELAEVLAHEGRVIDHQHADLFCHGVRS